MCRMCTGTKSMTIKITEGMAWGIGKIWRWPQELVNFAYGGLWVTSSMAFVLHP